MNKTLSSKNKNVVLFDLDYTLFDTDLFKKSNLKKYALYPEIEPMLKDLSLRMILGIFSEGESDFQKLKIKKTALKKYFLPDHIHITPAKDQIFTSVFSRYQNQTLYLVEDKLNILYLAKCAWPEIKTIWVKRGIYAMNPKPMKGFAPDVTVTNLEEIIKII